jgi:hypothetical protein
MAGLVPAISFSGPDLAGTQLAAVGRSRRDHGAVSIRAVPLRKM